jgi:DNA-binding LacI/PurR family transcriptional regulator
LSSKRVTMRQIAEAAGVSRTTVSFVLNDLPGVNISPQTRQRILDIARELNYVPDTAAQNLARGRAGAVALILRQSPHQVISDAFLAPVVQGVAAATEDTGYHILLEPLDPTDMSASYGDLVRSRRADGILVSGPRTDDRELIRVYEERIPTVMMGQLPGSNIPFVDVDNVRGAKVAVQHLIGLGHRRIACITNAPLAYTASRDRLEGYRQALEEADLAYTPSLVRYGDFTDEGGAQAMKDLLARCDPPPTAAFVASDVVALGTLSATRAAGLRVPDDMALVGFDDIPLAQYVDPPLTTVRLPAYSLGWGSGQMLLRLIDDPSDVKETHVLLETELIVRESCGVHLT